MHTLARSVLIGGTVMATLAASFALGRGPAHTFRDKPFQDWREDIGTLAMISARLEALNRPKMVPTESIRPIDESIEPVERDPLMVDLVEPVPPPKRTKTGVTPADICTMHGMRKVYYGSTWRCRK